MVTTRRDLGIAKGFAVWVWCMHEFWIMDDIQLVIREYEKIRDGGGFNFQVCPTRTNGKNEYHRIDVVAALIESTFSVGPAARLLGRSRSGLLGYIERNPEVSEWYYEERETCLDYAEKNMYEAAMKGDLNAAKFLLSTVAKSRGYSTRQEATGPNGMPIQTANSHANVLDMDISDLSPEEAADVLARFGFAPESS